VAEPFACTQTQRDELQAAIATGAQSFSHSGSGGSKSGTLRTQAEMLDMLARMDAYLTPAARKRRLHVVGFR
jgi:hypothetical protein